MRFRTFAAVLICLATLAALSAPYVRSYTRAAALIIGMTGIEGPAKDALAFETELYTVSDVSIPSRHGPLRGRLFVPAHVRRAVVLVPGLHAIGIDEPRLYNLAIQLAQVGLAVLTPEMPDLSRYAITARTTDMIEDSARWLTTQTRIARRGRVGIIGISFAGGLAVIAAGRPSVRDHVAFVFAFGGHASFPRVLRFLCSGKIPADLPPAGAPASYIGPETYLRPHDYGVAVLLLGLADRLVPADQVVPLRTAILEYLTASCYDLINLKMAMATYKSANAMADALPEPSRTLMKYVNTRDVDKLGAYLLPILSQIGNEPALSADISPAPTAPVYLLHGTGDNVVPAIETRFLARYLEGKTLVRALLSGLITHAELNNEQGLSEAWKLIDFFADLLRE
jgi:pimeloyl-ACP methyl ester carboxylesterase